MANIKKYQQFIKETFTPTTSDPTDIQSDMNKLSRMEKFLKEYNSKKAILEEIYKKNSKPEQIRQALVSAKLIKSTGDPKKIIFENPFIEHYARICRISAEIERKQNTISDLKKAETEITKNDQQAGADASNNPVITVNDTQLQKTQTEGKDLEDELQRATKKFKDFFNKTKK